MYKRCFFRPRQEGVPNLTNHQFAQLPFLYIELVITDLSINPTNCKYIAKGRAPLHVFSVVEAHDDSQTLLNIWWLPLIAPAYPKVITERPTPK